MTRLNLALLILLMICALGLISAQHQTRKLFMELQKEQEKEKQLNVEWGQLQLEQSTWATHARVENIATRALGMQLPELKKVRTVALENDHATVIPSPGTKEAQP
jgi:cell division protein FtsL